MFGILVAELGEHAQLHRKAILRRQHLAVVGQREKREATTRTVPSCPRRRPRAEVFASARQTVMEATAKLFKHDFRSNVRHYFLRVHGRRAEAPCR
jgi:hypothetical protein